MTLFRRRLIDCRGVDFDDPEYGFKEEDKHPVKVRIRGLPCRW